MKKKKLHAIEIKGVPCDVFSSILASVRKDDGDTDENNLGGWALLIPEIEDGEGMLVLYPRFIMNVDTRRLIERELRIRLRFYDFVYIVDDR